MGEYKGEKVNFINTERSEEGRMPPVERSGTFYYLCTIKRNAIEYTKKDWLDYQYIRLQKCLKNTEWSDNVSYELDSLNRLHLHTIVSSLKEIYYKKYIRKGWHIHFAKFPKDDYPKVIQYINKTHQHKALIEQRELESQIYNLQLENIFR